MSAEGWVPEGGTPIGGEVVLGDAAVASRDQQIALALDILRSHEYGPFLLLLGVLAPDGTPGIRLVGTVESAGEKPETRAERRRAERASREAAAEFLRDAEDVLGRIRANL